MKSIKKIILRTWLVIVLLVVGFAAGLPIGKSIGFTKGSEWAIVQADIVARQMGLRMPVHFQDGNFRVVVKQSRHLHKQAWRSADKYQRDMEIVNKGERPLIETANIAQSNRIIE